MGRAILLGGTAGALVALGVWFYAARKLDEQLVSGGSDLSGELAAGRAELAARLRSGEVELQNRIRTEVRTVMDQRLAEAGITRETGDRLSRLLSAAEAAGVLR